MSWNIPFSSSTLRLINAVIGMHQLGWFVCFSQDGELALERFDPCAAVPDSCTEWPTLHSEVGRPSVVLSGLQATLYGWGCVVTTLLPSLPLPHTLPSPLPESKITSPQPPILSPSAVLWTDRAPRSSSSSSLSVVYFRRARRVNATRR